MNFGLLCTFENNNKMKHIEFKFSIKLFGETR